MNNSNQLLQQLLGQKNDYVGAEALQLGNELIKEFRIMPTKELAEFLEIELDVNDQKAVRIWTQRQLHRIDPDETDNERYRQLRHLFDKQFPESMLGAYDENVSYTQLRAHQTVGRISFALFCF